MSASLRDDRRLTRRHIQALSSADQLAGFFTDLGYPADERRPMTPQALQLNTTLTNATRRVERLTSVEAGALQVYLFELTSVTVAHTRGLARAFRKYGDNFLLVLTDDYVRIDFVLLERELPGLTDNGPSRRGIIVRPRVLSVDRRDPDRVHLRVLRRFTLTEFDAGGRPDPYAQYDKLSSAYTVAEWSEPLFNNRALFSDYYLNQRLPEDPAWEAADRNRAFRQVRGDFAQARRRFAGEDAATTRQNLIRPLLETLGFRVAPGSGGTAADFRLYTDDSDQVRAFALAYPWNRYLDGKGTSRDDERPEENPGAQVVSLLDAGTADWGIVTNGKIWRLYSARAHSRATNYYEINLEETLASPDPGEAFRYFYLFFRAQAFAPYSDPKGLRKPLGSTARELTFLDWLMEESQAYARELGERLKERVFEKIFPHFAQGFIAGLVPRPGLGTRPGLGGADALLALPEDEREAQLQLVYEGTLTFLYRLLFLLYAESRDLLPVREVRGYYQISLRRLKEEIAEEAGPLEDQVAARLELAYADHLPPAGEDTLYDRLLDLFAVIDRGKAARNVPIYNGGLFITAPDEDDVSREAQAARFLERTRLPDRYLALGLDRLARDIDPKRLDLGFIDYKSLGVRQLGSIYEGLLEFKVRVAAEKMAVVEGKRTEEVVPYAEAVRDGRKILTHGRGTNAAERTFPRGAVYLENDRRERKATGSYYTPDYIVKYIVRHTVGPVLDEKLDALRPRLQDAERRFHTRIKRKREVEGVTPDEPAVLHDIAGDVLYDLFDVKILDPAMGSGHFLVEAVDYVTDRLVRFLDGFPFLGVFFQRMRRSILEELERQQVTVDPARLTDVTLLKRHVLKRCIYGVDLNPMAVELAKVSLWLDCFTLGAPLSFLNHHLRLGNSLIGAMAQDVEEEMGAATPDGQTTFLTGPFVGLLQATSLMQTLAGIADVTVEQVHESRTLFDDFERQAKPFKQLLDVHVAQHFGVERAVEFLALYGAEAMQADPEELSRPYRQVVERTRALYEEKRFFHWDLEFPEVFIDLERARWKEEGGFDAVVGNPPWVNIGREPGNEELVRFFKSTTRTAEYQVDLYTLFLERSLYLLQNHCRLGMIVPDSWIANYRTPKIRRLVLVENQPVSLLHTPRSAFPEVGAEHLVVVVRKSHRGSHLDFARGHLEETGQVNVDRKSKPSNMRADEGYILYAESSTAGLIRTVERHSIPLSELYETVRGIGPYHHTKHTDQQIRNRVFHADHKKDDTFVPLLEGKHIQRYEVNWDQKTWISYGAWLSEPREPRFFRGKRLLLREILGVRFNVVLLQERFVVDRGVYIALQSSQTVNTLYVLSALASKLLVFWFREKFSEKDELFPKLRVSHFNLLPIRLIHFSTPEAERERFAAELIGLCEEDEHETLLAEVEALLPKNDDGEFLAFQPGATGAEEKSDVVHDLLAHLAEQMMAMHKQKQQRVDAFWEDLEEVTAPSIFEDLSEHGKWEQSLAKDPACRPYVDPESRSTRHLDESLGWDADCFAAFAGMLAGKTSVTPPLLDVYRRHHPAYKTLTQRIAATDNLIDQIVYRLYGLTEEEIAVVEGERP
ncbi:MAG: Modification methylase PaeR7I [Anaerolineales bacterium]|nr:Modification methylase PaeR7I [Anaerolineales bacterium]